MKWNEVMKELNIGRNKFFKISKELFTDKHIHYSNEDIELIKKKLSETNIIIVDENNIEPIGENEYYAKLIRNNELYSVGAFSSTDLNIDTERFRRIGIELVVIDYEEANRLYKQLYGIKIN